MDTDETRTISIIPLGLCILSIAAFGMGWGGSVLFDAVSAAEEESLSITTPVKMRPWRYIVVHHSGAMVGNAEIIESGHLQRGMENGMAYHFLIGNGTARLGDGTVVEGHRWKNQLQGGHSHQDLLNESGIGICLVGDFGRKGPTNQQIQSLAGLIFRLQTQFQIPDDNIHGHGRFYGEDTDCPGKLFPWTNVWSAINAIYQK